MNGLPHESPDRPLKDAHCLPLPWIACSVEVATSELVPPFPTGVAAALELAKSGRRTLLVTEEPSPRSPARVQPARQASVLVQHSLAACRRLGVHTGRPVHARDAQFCDVRRFSQANVSPELIALAAESLTEWRQIENATGTLLQATGALCGLPMIDAWLEERCWPPSVLTVPCLRPSPPKDASMSSGKSGPANWTGHGNSCAPQARERRRLLPFA